MLTHLFLSLSLSLSLYLGPQRDVNPVSDRTIESTTILGRVVAVMP